MVLYDFITNNDLVTNIGLQYAWLINSSKTISAVNTWTDIPLSIYYQPENNEYSVTSNGALNSTNGHGHFVSGAVYITNLTPGDIIHVSFWYWNSTDGLIQAKNNIVAVADNTILSVSIPLTILDMTNNAYFLRIKNQTGARGTIGEWCTNITIIRARFR